MKTAAIKRAATLGMAVLAGYHSITKETGKKWDYDLKSREWFDTGEVMVNKKYFALYEIAGYRFHQPIDEVPDEIADNEIIDLGEWLGLAVKHSGKVRIKDAMETLKGFVQAGRND